MVMDLTNTASNRIKRCAATYMSLAAEGGANKENISFSDWRHGRGPTGGPPEWAMMPSPALPWMVVNQVAGKHELLELRHLLDCHDQRCDALRLVVRLKAIVLQVEDRQSRHRRQGCSDDLPALSPEIVTTEVKGLQGL
eukprot:CAMPEP_0181172950 /NCGR_PEP_ID=MMETSP1096-20121128/2726_1 /TAXON_ID=156174 ORGANISM="Chrysochromulina ericina, Strain CCMP281" /NCGR_SAMPLE_ID=MMETSP1096 /ASSEMBLY_ACC=CAM_ASM_000453 /LENGTH=138 /DNA_ID=CAMNT_0023260719 /DNA_START=15 /DNA_END=431 /DNA_ORIENTATION=-